jgi:3-oxoacyl-[acyl-carrier-protein] synthase II
MDRRVVITGIGAITPAGGDARSSWEAALAGRSGIRRITRFDPSPYKTQIAGEIRDFDPTKYMDRKDARRLDRIIQLAVNAAGEAVQDAGLQVESLDRERCGVMIGTGIGGISTIIEHQRVLETQGPGRISPFFVPSCLPDMSAGYVAIQYGFRGPNMCVTTACATGNNVIGEAMEVIRRKKADLIVAGGVESGILPLTVAGFDQMGATACDCNDNPCGAVRPFDKRRAGFVMGEGSGVLVIEELEHARRRGARIYAELAGYGTCADAYHIAAPDPSGAGAARSMRLALEDAGMEPAEIQYINAHGTGTPLNDTAESGAIRKVFGAHADQLVVSSTKPVTGHLLGAAGAVESIFSALALYEGIIPPTINYQEPDPTCDLDYAPNASRKATLTGVMSNSFGFGGHNATLVFRRSKHG